MADLKSELKPGDVVVLTSHGRKTTGKVAKIGRSLVHIQEQGSSRVEAYRLDTQRFNGHNVGTGRLFRTLDQEAAIERENAARAALADRGLTIERGHTYTTEQLEQIAALIDTFEVQTGG